jgi:predicted amidohydrolase YtcJ
MQATGSLLIHNANILTLSDAMPRAEAVVVIDGIIQAVGDWPEIAFYRERVDRTIDAAGATLVPGFIDTHVHFTLTGLGLLAIDLGAVETLGALLDKVHATAGQMPPDRLVLALNFQPEQVREKRFPTADELEQAGGGRPVYVMESGGHWCAVNHTALAALKAAEDEAGIQRDESGKFQGVLTDAANTLAFTQFWQRFGQEVGVARAFEAAAGEAVRGGVTTVHALDDLENVRALLAHADRLPVRVVPYAQTKDVAAVKELGLKQIGGCGQVMVDGDFGPHTAALLEPYADAPDTCGTLYYTDQELYDYVAAAHRAGLQMGLHCLGSGAIEQLLGTYERVLAEAPRSDHRHRIEHFQLPAEGQRERARTAGLGLAMQPSFNHFWPHYQGYPEVIGEDRARRIDPVRSVLAQGLPVAFGSDSPVTPMRPLLWMHAAVNHSNPDERIDVAAALHACTVAGSWLAFEEGIKGTLERGKLGDMVLLGEDPLVVPGHRLEEIQVLATIVGGRIVFADESHPEVA